MESDNAKAIFGSIAGTFLMIVVGVVGYNLFVHNTEQGQHPVVDNGSRSSEAASSSTPKPMPAPAPSTPVAALTYEAYVATEDAEVYSFTVSREGDFRLAVAIEGNAPVDVYTGSGSMSREEWVVNATAVEMASTFGALMGEKAKDVFSGPWSKKAAYRRFDSPWARLTPGEYHIVLDNTQAFTPSRGDAFVHLSIFEK